VDSTGCTWEYFIVTKHKEKERKRGGEEDIKSGGFLTKHAFLLQITQIQSILVPYTLYIPPMYISHGKRERGVGWDCLF
jgi:hypothetical protein